MAVPVRLQRTDVEDLGNFLGSCGTSQRRIRRGLKLHPGLTRLEIRKWRVVGSGNYAQAVSVAKEQCGKFGIANARCVCQHRIEYRLQFAGRTADDLQHFGGRGLALARLTEFAGELVKLVPQACRGRVLDRRFAGLGPIRARNFHRPAPTAMHWLRRGWYQLSRVPRKWLAPGLHMRRNKSCPLYPR